MSNSFATLWTVACQAPLSVGVPRQEYWSGLSFPSPGDLPDPGIEPESLALSGGFFTTESPGEAWVLDYNEGQGSESCCMDTILKDEKKKKKFEEMLGQYLKSSVSLQKKVFSLLLFQFLCLPKGLVEFNTPKLIQRRELENQTWGYPWPYLPHFTSHSVFAVTFTFFLWKLSSSH